MMRIERKSFIGAIAALLVVAGGVLYTLHWRASLEEQGLPQVVQYMEVELSRKLCREYTARGLYPTPGEVASFKEFEVTAFRMPFLPLEQASVEVTVRTPRGDRTYDFTFKRALGTWRLQHTASSLLTGW
jgi:hypothetical protein